MRASTLGCRFLDRCGDSLGVEIRRAGPYSYWVAPARAAANLHGTAACEQSVAHTGKRCAGEVQERCKRGARFTSTLQPIALRPRSRRTRRGAR